MKEGNKSGKRDLGDATLLVKNVCVNSIIGKENPSLASSFVTLLFFAGFLVEETGLDFVIDDLLGSLEGVLETFGQLCKSSGSLGLSMTLSLLESPCGGSSLTSCVSGGSSLRKSGVCWVKSLHHGSVFKRVLLGGSHGNSGGLDASDNRLDGVRVDDSGKISAVHDFSLEVVSSLDSGSCSVGSEDGIELLEGVLGEDNESSEVTTRGELEEVKSVDVANINTGEVSGNSLDGGGLVTVDNKRSLSDDKSGVSHLTVSSSLSFGFADSVEIVSNTDGVKGGDEALGLLIGGESG